MQYSLSQNSGSAADEANAPSSSPNHPAPKHLVIVFSILAAFSLLWLVVLLFLFTPSSLPWIQICVTLIFLAASYSQLPHKKTGRVFYYTSIPLGMATLFVSPLFNFLVYVPLLLITLLLSMCWGSTRRLIVLLILATYFSFMIPRSLAHVKRVVQTSRALNAGEATIVAQETMPPSQPSHEPTTDGWLLPLSFPRGRHFEPEGEAIIAGTTDPIHTNYDVYRSQIILDIDGFYYAFHHFR